MKKILLFLLFSLPLNLYADTFQVNLFDFSFFEDKDL